MNKSWAWEEFKAREGKPGLCVCCDERLPKGRRILCGSRECLRVMAAVYARGRRECAPLVPIVKEERIDRIRARYTLDCGHVVVRSHTRPHQASRCDQCRRARAA